MPSATTETRIWSEPFKVLSYEVDFRRRATLETLCRYFQEAAWNHAETLGVGYNHLRAERKFWVLSRLRIEVERYPLWGDRIKVITWPRGTERIFALRDFEFYDAQEKRLAAGSSAWLVLSADTHRPQRVDKLLSSISTLPERRALVYDLQKLPEDQIGAHITSFEVRYSDMDVNGHVNNSRYVNWVLNSYPMEFHQTHSAQVLDVNYMGETRAGDNVSVLTYELHPCEFQHTLVNADNPEPVCRARLLWQKASCGL